jgi:hypothetical protein
MAHIIETAGRTLGLPSEIAASRLRHNLGLVPRVSKLVTARP